MKARKFLVFIIMCALLIIPINTTRAAGNIINPYVDAYTFYGAFNHVASQGLAPGVGLQAPQFVSEDSFLGSRTWVCHGNGYYNVLLTTDLDNMVTRVIWVSPNQDQFGRMFLCACYAIQMVNDTTLPSKQSIQADNSHWAYGYAMTNFNKEYYWYSQIINKKIYVNIAFESGKYAGILRTDY